MVNPVTASSVIFFLHFFSHWFSLFSAHPVSLCVLRSFPFSSSLLFLNSRYALNFLIFGSSSFPTISHLIYFAILENENDFDFLKLFPVLKSLHRTRWYWNSVLPSYTNCYDNQIYMSADLDVHDAEILEGLSCLQAIHGFHHG